MLEQHVSQMHFLANLLVSYSYPRVSQEEEEKISILKQRSINIQGYECVVCLSKSSTDSLFLTTLQIFNKYQMFLPFSLVCEIAKLFLGKDNLCFLDFFHDEKDVKEGNLVTRATRKVYMWILFKDIYGDTMKGESVYNNGVKYDFDNFSFIKLSDFQGLF